MENTDFFFCLVEKHDGNKEFLDSLSVWANTNKKQTYVIRKPLIDKKYDYEHQNAIVVLIPNHKISFIDFSGFKNEVVFNNYIEDFQSDLVSLSDKYLYQQVIGRPRIWKDYLFSVFYDGKFLSVEKFIEESLVQKYELCRTCELLISLLIGSINDPQKVGKDEPSTLLEKVKKKIILFDTQQTDFIYGEVSDKAVRIQGLSGAGKTELLLHKLRELYTFDSNSKIAFTCHNKILAKELSARIPIFFDQMKVEQQILWNERLWCTHAWGSSSNKDSGIYRYICDFYKIPFYPWNPLNSFEKVCQLSLDNISQNNLISLSGYAFDFILIDESQDFPESFFKLCEYVTNKKIYIAGDIFQCIFDKLNSYASPNYLLSKCYRTDPKTLMFAHALGMGLYENPKLRWLTPIEWSNCGYNYEENNSSEAVLKRNPVRRFEDVEDVNDFQSISIFQSNTESVSDIISAIIEALQNIKLEFSDVTVNDIGVILIDDSKKTYEIGTNLTRVVQEKFHWKVNLAYVSKMRVEGELFVSNRNNVKGLEFPFVICVTNGVLNSMRYRNTIYMGLTRSFLKSFIVIPNVESNKNMIEILSRNLDELNSTGNMTVAVPSDAEQKEIEVNQNLLTSQDKFENMLAPIFDKLRIDFSARAIITEKLITINMDQNYELTAKELELFITTLNKQI